MISQSSSVAVRGLTEPRLYTRERRELTPDTSLGFEVIDFAKQFLDIELFPWQKWLLIHALELNSDGTYRFRRVICLVARQNGKTLLLTVLALWWLFVDCDRFENVRPDEFLVLGTAQSLNLAEEAWERAVSFCDPDDLETLDTRIAVPALQRAALPAIRGNGRKRLRLKSGARYEVRAATRKAGRGKGASRVIMDELREQQNWEAWAAISKTLNAAFNSQLWGISNAGDATSVVLKRLRETSLKSLDDESTTTALFEWSAPDDCDIDDTYGIAQANPSLGYGEMTWESVTVGAHDEPDGVYRTEVLCQWVTARVIAYIDQRAWRDCIDVKSRVADDARIMLGVDVSEDRRFTTIALAAKRSDDLLHVEVIKTGAGSHWVVDELARLIDEHAALGVAVQARGAPAAEFVDALREREINVVEVSGTALGISTGRMHDRVRDNTLRHRDQPILNLAVSGAVARSMGDIRIWDRRKSMVDIAPLVAVSHAAYALEATSDVRVVSAYEEHDLLVV